MVNKGVIITESGYSSPQIDLLVLSPSYPPMLLGEKRYLAGGVVAAFECKTTLKAEHIKEAVKTAAEIRRNLPKRLGSPYKELNSTINFGLLAHSHSWKGAESNPIDNVERAFNDADSQYVQHPIESIDVVSIADLASWTVFKFTYDSPRFVGFNPELSGPEGSAQTSYICSPIGKNISKSLQWVGDQED